MLAAIIETVGPFRMELKHTRSLFGALAEALRGCGLSRAKVAALQDLARRVEDGELPTLDVAQDIPDAELIERLVRVRGIGRWSAQMFLMFHLGRPDVLPVDDYSLRKAYATAFRKPVLPTPEELEKAGKRWRPYRTVASWYLWRILDQRQHSAVKPRSCAATGVTRLL